MDAELSDEQLMLQEMVRRFLKEEVSTASIRDRAGVGPAFLPDFWTRAASLGWTSMLIPDDRSAQSTLMPVKDLAIIAEEAGRALQPGPLLHCNIVANTLVREGSSELREALLPGIASGNLTASWAFAEDPDAWDVSDVKMTAKSIGKGFTLNGVKTSVEAADTSDFFMVTAVADYGLAQFIVPRDAEGIRITMLPTLDLSRSFGEIEFSDVPVAPSSHVVGVTPTDEVVESQLLLALTLQCAEMVGTLDEVFSWTLEYMQDRYAFGRPISSYQSLKHRVADHKVWLEAAFGISTFLTRACAMNDPSAMELAYAAKAHIGEQSLDIISDCAQIFGGISMTWEHDLHLYLRRATVNRTLFGSPEQMREHLCSLAGL